MALTFSDGRLAPSRTTGMISPGRVNFPSGSRVPYNSLSAATGTSKMNALKRARVSNVTPGAVPAWPASNTPGRSNRTLASANRPFFIVPIYRGAYAQQGDYVFILRDDSPSIDTPIEVKNQRVNHKAHVGGNLASINARLAEMQVHAQSFFGQDLSEMELMQHIQRLVCPIGVQVVGRFHTSEPDEKRRRFAAGARRAKAYGRLDGDLLRTPASGEKGRIVTICSQNDCEIRKVRGHLTRPGDKIFIVLKRMHSLPGTYYLGAGEGTVEVQFTRAQLDEGIWQYAFVSLPMNQDMTADFLKYTLGKEATNVFYGDFTYLYNVQGLRETQTQLRTGTVAIDPTQGDTAFVSVETLENSSLAAGVVHFAG